jgi:hypothetical protein
LISTSSLAPPGLPRNGEQSSLALILKSEALTVDAADNRMVQHAIEHRHREHSTAGEGRVPTAEGEIRSEDHRARA